MAFNGYGQTLSLSSAQRISFPEAVRKVSIYNAGSTVVYSAVSCSLTEFAAIISAGTAIPIPPSQAFVFDSLQLRGLSEICLQPASGTNTVYLGAF